MKINFKSIILSLAAFAAFACTPAAIEDLKGIYSAPTDLTVETAKVASIDKQEGFRFITLNLSGQDQVVIKFASKDYYLTPTTYYNNPAEGIKAGMYQEGASTVNGQAITFGGITVACSPADGDNYNYTISGVVEVGDNVRKKIDWSGVLTFEPDPEAIVLKNVLSTQNNVPNGTNSVTLNLATASVTSEYDAATWSTVYKGDGFYAAMDIYSEDGYLHEGTYKACKTGGAINEGEFGIGWDPGDLWGIGMIFVDWGTCWWTVDNGATSAEKITSGEIVVSKKGSKWVIEYNNYDVNGIWFKFEGAIEDLTKPEGGDVKPEWYFFDNVGDVYDASYAVVAGVKSHAIYVAKDAETLMGGSFVATFSLILPEGVSEIEGEYDVIEYAAEAYKAGNGYSFPDWGLLGGSYYYKGDDLVLINPGEKISVAKLADGCYSFSGNGYEFIAADDSFTGGGSGSDEPATVYDMVMNLGGEGSVTDESNTPVAGFDRYDVQLLDGENIVAAFDLVLTTGSTDFEGDYEVKGYPHADHIAGNGWGIAAWNYYGGSRFADGNGGWIYVNPGSTITVSRDSDGVFTFEAYDAKLQSAADGSEEYTGNFKFKGQLK